MTLPGGLWVLGGGLQSTKHCKTHPLHSASTTGHTAAQHKSCTWAAASLHVCRVVAPLPTHISPRHCSHCGAAQNSRPSCQPASVHTLTLSITSVTPWSLQDTSTGHIVAQHKTKMGPCDVLRHNPYNGVSLLGHANGTVTMWAPNTGTPLVKMLVHRVRPGRCTVSCSCLRTSQLKPEVERQAAKSGIRFS